MVDRSFQPDWFSKPGDTLLTLMEERELTSESVALKLGCSNAVVRGLLAGTVAVDSNLAVALSKHVGGTPKFWQVRQKKYYAALSQTAGMLAKQEGADWVKQFPHADLARLGCINHTGIGMS